MERLRQEKEAKEREEEKAKLALQELEQKRAVWHCCLVSIILSNSNCPFLEIIRPKNNVKRI